MPDQVRHPSAPEVVALDIAEVQVLVELRVVPAAGFDVFGVRRQESAEFVTFAGLCSQGIDLGAEFLEQRLEIGPVVHRVHDIAGIAVIGPGPFPVDIDAIEDPRSRTRAAAPVNHGQIPFEVEVHAAGDELLPGGISGRRGGEVLGPGPTTQRDHRLDAGVLGFELFDLVERTGEFLIPTISGSGDRIGGGLPHAVVRPGVACAIGAVGPVTLGLIGHEALQALIVDIAEGVVEVGQLVRAAGVLEPFELEVPGVDAPLRKVADIAVAVDRAALLGGRGCGRGARCAHGDQAGGEGERGQPRESRAERAQPPLVGVFPMLAGRRPS